MLGTVPAKKRRPQDACKAPAQCVGAAARGAARNRSIWPSGCRSQAAVMGIAIQLSTGLCGAWSVYKEPNVEISQYNAVLRSTGISQRLAMLLRGTLTPSPPSHPGDGMIVIEHECTGEPLSSSEENESVLQPQLPSRGCKELGRLAHGKELCARLGRRWRAGIHAVAAPRRVQGKCMAHRIAATARSGGLRGASLRNRATQRVVGVLGPA